MRVVEMRSFCSNSRNSSINWGANLKSVLIERPTTASPQILSLGKDSLSTNNIFKLDFANASAHDVPAGPAPTIITS